MSKNHRGKGLKNVPKRGRGICPICGRTAVKIVWEWKNKEGKTVNVCKLCKSTDPQTVEL